MDLKTSKHKVPFYDPANPPDILYEKYIKYGKYNLGGTMLGPYDACFTVHEDSDDGVNWRKLEKPVDYVYVFDWLKDAVDFFSHIDPESARMVYHTHLTLYKDNEKFKELHKEEIEQYEKEKAEGKHSGKVDCGGKLYMTDISKKDSPVIALDLDKKEEK